MDYLLTGLKDAFGLIFSCNSDFISIVFVSIKIASISTLLGILSGVPIGIMLAEKQFPGRDMIITMVNTLMSLPTVVVGLVIYSFFSRRGPLGECGLLFTQAAMVIGQFVLILPIISGLTVAAVRSLDRRVWATIISLGADNRHGFFMFLHEARYGILAAIIAGFGRVFSEVGVSMMLGGNIKAYTRTITTAIALETSKGEFALGIALGIVLLTVALLINLVFGRFQKRLHHE